jgi:hypothetical protein
MFDAIFYDALRKPSQVSPGKQAIGETESAASVTRQD